MMLVKGLLNCGLNDYPKEVDPLREDEIRDFPDEQATLMVKRGHARPLTEDELDSIPGLKTKAVAKPGAAKTSAEPAKVS